MKRSRINRVSSSQRRTIERELDRLFQEVVTACGVCAMCGREYGLAAHHIIGRRYKWYRHDQTNGVCLCFHCHGWAHDHPKEFLDWLKETDIVKYEAYESNKGGRSQGPVPMSVLERWKDELK